MNEEDDRLEKLKRGLYSREGVRLDTEPRHQAEKEDPPVQEDWEYESPQEPIEEPAPSAGIQGNRPWLPVLLYVSLGLFLLASGTFVYRIFVSGMFSTNDVVIEVDAPRTASAGEEVELTVTVDNRNNAPIQDAVLTVEFPEHTYAADESGEVVDRFSRELGTVAGGETMEEEFEVFLFGQEDESVEFEVGLEYVTESSSATLTTEEVYEIEIVSAPITLAVRSSFDEVQSGNDFEIEVEVSSNTNATLHDLILTVEYPGGFSLEDANPAPIADNGVWDIGTLEPRESETVVLRGLLEGQNEEERFFIVGVGSEGSASQNQITRLFAEAREGVTIIEPPIALRTEINKNSSETVSVSGGGEVDVTVEWENTLREDLLNLRLEVELDNRLVEAGSVRAREGFFRSSSNTIVWDRTTDPDLGEIEGQDSGQVTFSFRARTLEEVGSGLVPLTIHARAGEPQGDITPRPLSNILTREIRLASSLGATQALSHRNGAFMNTGPVPPRVGEETTYTVTWEVVPSARDADDVVARAALPTYVEFIESGSSDIEVSPLTREVVWRAGSVSGPRQVSFQIGLEPSSSQIGTSPILVREMQVRGEDAESGENLSGFAPALRTSSLAEQGSGPVIE